MIEFCGELSDNCQLAKEKRNHLYFTIYFSIIMLFVFIISNVIATLYGFWFITAAATVVTILCMLFMFIPFKRVILASKSSFKIIIDDEIISRIDMNDNNKIKTKPISHVSCVIDCGNWYYILIGLHNLADVWVCEKKLLTNGSLENFEKQFHGKIKIQKK